MKKMNLLGKTQKDVDSFFNEAVENMIKEFHQKYKEATYENIYDYVSATTKNDSDTKLFVPVKKISLNQVPNDLTIGQAKKLVAQTDEAYKLYCRARHLDPMYDVMQELMDEYVRASFPTMKLTKKQISALTYEAYENGHSYGYMEILSVLSDYIEMVQKFLDVE